MHSFQPSRGRILFEVLCALTVAASLAAAWLQTGATAFLPGAGAAALYGLAHLFDMKRRTAVEQVEPQRIDFAPDEGDVPPVSLNAEEPMPAVVVPIAVAVEETELAAPVAERTGGGRRKGGSRKGSGRRSDSAKAARNAEQKLPQVPEAFEPAPPATVAEVELPEAAPVAEPPQLEESEVAEREPHEPENEAVAHIPVAPLFEPEPFARQPRAVFGRKAG